MCIWLKLKLFLMCLRCIQVACGSTNSICINGRYVTASATKGKPQVELELRSAADIEVDDNVFFTCKVRANPAAEIFWFYEGDYIRNSMPQQQIYVYSECNTTLTIRFAEPADTGRYSCMARNSYGETTSATRVLAVRQKAKFIRNYKDASIKTTRLTSCDEPELEGLTVSCTHNESKGICVWKRNNQTLNETTASFCDPRMCCLSFSDFSKENEGLYTCFMYFDVRKADVEIRKQEKDGDKCNAATTKDHNAVWYSGISALIMAVVWF